MLAGGKEEEGLAVGRSVFEMVEMVLFFFSVQRKKRLVDRSVCGSIVGASRVGDV